MIYRGLGRNMSRYAFLLLYGFGIACILLFFQAGRDLFAFTWNRTDVWLSVVAILFVSTGFVLGFRSRPVRPGKSEGIFSENNPQNSLSRREKDVLNELLQNKSNKEICSALFIENSTLKTHVNRIYKKLQVRNRMELLVRCGTQDAG